jgi:acetylornithine deacetylase
VLREAGGRLYGRGTADMKGFLAACLALAPDMARADIQRPIHILVSYDEETTCRGVLPLIDHLMATLPPVSAVIVGEPTEMRPADSHRSGYVWRVDVTGRAAHSSMPERGVSAISLAAGLVKALDAAILARPDESGHAGVIAGGVASNVLADCCSLEWGLARPAGSVAGALPHDHPGRGREAAGTSAQARPRSRD